MPTVSTASPPKPVKLTVTVEGRPMSETEATKLANCVKSSVRWELGLSGDYKDGDDPLEVVLSAPSLPAESESEPSMPESPALPEKASAEAIAAMSTPEYKAAKAAGTV